LLGPIGAHAIELPSQFSAKFLARVQRARLRGRRRFFRGEQGAKTRHIAVAADVVVVVTGGGGGGGGGGDALGRRWLRLRMARLGNG
jgi:hypothetical protein